MPAAKKKQDAILDIPAPNLEVAEFVIVGTAPYMQNAFSAKAREKMKADQEAGSQGKSRKKREPKDFQALYESAIHRSHDGWAGIPAPAFRAAMISACRTCSVVMTRAKLAVFVEPDGFDAIDATPLVRILKGEPEYHEGYVRNETGVVDLRPRPMWAPKWAAKIRIRFDQDMLSMQDVGNLLARVGMQVGIGEGRPDSKKSTGMGWGLFRLGNEGDL